MKISAWYYHEYSDRVVPDPDVAYSGLTVEVGGEDATIHHFDAAYFFHVATIGYLKSNEFRLGKPFAIIRSLIIVSRLEDAIVEAALESILDKLPAYGIFDALDYPIGQLMGNK